MTVSVPATVTGGLQTGMTAPVWTVAADGGVDFNGRAGVVTGLTSGSAASVRFHAISDPFAFTFYRPKSFRTLGNPNPVTGKYASVPKNVSSFNIRKGVNVAANNVPEIMEIRVEIRIPAGSDQYDPQNVRAGFSLAAGIMKDLASGVGDTLVTGVL